MGISPLLSWSSSFVLFQPRNRMAHHQGSLLNNLFLTALGAIGQGPMGLPLNSAVSFVVGRPLSADSRVIRFRIPDPPATASCSYRSSAAADGQLSLKTKNLPLWCEALGLNQLRHTLVAQHPVQLADSGMDLPVK